MSYDSRPDTWSHISRVRELLGNVARDVIQRADEHDRSKLVEPELAVFDEFTPKLAELTYGSAAYKAAVEAMGEGLQHHYAVNSHHPEHGSPGMEWRDVVGFEGLYHVSNYGDVRTTARTVPRDGGRGDLTTPERVLRAQVTPKGYLRIQLGRDGQSANRMVHRLVAEAFIPNPSGRPEVNHLDGDKQNNVVANLEWATPSENQLHAYETGLREPAVKYVVHCPELDLTTFGMQAMERVLRERGYEHASAAGVWSAMDRGGKHLDLTFEGTLLLDYRRSLISEMSLLDLIEMLCDWKAAAERVSGGDLLRSIEQNQERFGYSDELKSILLATVAELDLA